MPLGALRSENHATYTTCHSVAQLGRVWRRVQFLLTSDPPSLRSRPAIPSSPSERPPPNSGRSCSVRMSNCSFKPTKQKRRAMAEVIDIDDDPPFLPNDWINRGKTYPAKDTPLSVQNARKAIYTIPPIHQHLFPTPSITPFQFCDLDLPARSSAKILDAHLWFSSDPPTTPDISGSLLRPIPNLEAFQKIDQAFGQAWFDGKLYVGDPSGHDRFDFVILPIWRDLNHLANKQIQWKRYLSVLAAKKRQAEERGNRVMTSTLIEVEDRLHRMGWEERLQYCRAMTNSFQLGGKLFFESFYTN